MSELLGENGLIYVGGVKIPLANEWSLSIEVEKIEAPRVFICPADPTAKWVTKSPGYFSGSGSISALYDDSEDAAITAGMNGTVQETILYQDCEAATKYFIGDALFDITVNTTATEHITLELAFETTGGWVWSPDA